MTTAWLDLRSYSPVQAEAFIVAAVEHGVEAVVTNSATSLNGASDVLKCVRIFGSEDDANAEDGDGAIVVHPFRHRDNVRLQLGGTAGHRRGLLFDVKDSPSLEEACAAVRSGLLAVIDFRDPTKIPLEIVLAAGARRGAKVMTFARDLDDAEVTMSVLESGPDGIIIKPESMADVASVGELCGKRTSNLQIEEFVVTNVSNAGVGDRACVDTCSNFHSDEGLLVGSFGSGFLLCCSETHPLPYMPTRPFRVNAGVISSYVLTSEGHTNYLSDLRQGDLVLGVDVQGVTRPLVVGRCKIETRPLLLVKASAADGAEASVLLQNDWHVRVLGRGGEVLNITELRRGTVVLGHRAKTARHVGMPVDEFIIEQ